MEEALRVSYRKEHPLYFDEVENANVWSFYLVQRDLHHAFEDWIRANLPVPYAVWSRPEREGAGDKIGRATFPIGDTAASYRKPVPRAGDTVVYQLEALAVESSSAIIGFLGYLRPLGSQSELAPSVTAVWKRWFVQYEGDEREITPLPAPLRSALEGICPSDAGEFR